MTAPLVAVGATKPKRSREKREHTLSAIKRLAYPRRFVFFDSESTVRRWGAYLPDMESKPHVPRLVVAEAWDADENYHYEKTDARDWSGEKERVCGGFWGWVADLSSHRGARGTQGSVVVIGHNVAYDVQVTGGAARLMALGWRAQAPYSKGPVYIWRFTKDKRTVTLLSSTNFYAIALKKLGETFGLPKLDTETQTDDLEALKTYCRRDVAIARVAILDMVRFLRETTFPDGSVGIGPWADTISSVAFKAFRYRFLRYAIECHVNPEAERLERESYSGGRTEAHYVGHPVALPVYDLDKNSLYPSVMVDNLFPIRLLQVREGDLAALLDTVTTGGLVIADVDVETERPSLPFKTEKLEFPVGKFRTVLCSPELKVALREGRILDVRKWAVYEGAPIFTDYVATLYARRVAAREAGLDAIVQLFKNLLNNLYGKFGQRREDWVVLTDAQGTPLPAPLGMVAVTDYVREDGTLLVERIFDGRYWVAEPTKEAYNSFPAIASFVTSYARVSLLGAMNVAGNYDPERPTGRARRHFYYCDTDSLFVDQTGYDRLCAADMVDPNVLGKLKVEGVAKERVIFHGAKSYEFDDVRRFKGRPESARERWDCGPTCPDRVSADECPTHAATGRPVTTSDGEKGFVFDRWPKLATWLREGNLSSFENRPIVKRTAVEYTKGTVWADGWVQPLRYPRPVPVLGAPWDRAP